MKTKIKIGILIDNNSVDYFSFDLINWLKKDKSFKIIFLNRNVKTTNKISKFISLLLALKLLKILNLFFYKVLILI